MKSALPTLLSLALLLPAAGIGATPLCDRSQSLGKCYATRRAAPVADAAEERISSASTPEVASSLLNLIPPSFASLGIAGLTDTSDNLSYDHVFDLGDDWKLDLGVTVFRDPELFEALQKALPEADRSQLVETLSQDIGDFAKTDAKVVVSWQGKVGDHRFGRDPGAYQDEMISPWIEDGFAGFKPAETQDPLAAWGLSDDVMPLIAAYDGEFWSDPIKELVDALGEKKVADLEAGVKAAAEASRKVAAGFESWLETASEQIGQLVTNQPQLLAEGKYHQRSDLTGPSQWSARLCFEMGLSGNLNDFRQWARKQTSGKYESDCTPEGDGAEAEYPYECLRAYLGTRSKIGLRESAAKRRGHRLAIAGGYTKTQGLHLDRPDLGAEFDLDPGATWTGSATYGLYLPKLELPNLLWVFPATAGSQATGFARFDFEAKYDDVSGDPMKQSRFLATATLSQKMSNNTTLSLSAVYANRPEYRGTVDEAVSARFGFKWQADKEKPGT